MARRWHDLSIPLLPDMIVWPGDPRFRMEPIGRVQSGDSCNTSLLTCSTHTGTHVDAPWHFEPDGKTIEQIDPELFFGRAYLLDLSGADRINPEDFDRVALPRVLIKTKNSQFSHDQEFRKDFIALHPDAAQAVVDKNIKLVGIDYLSIAPYKAGAGTHHRLLNAGILVVEGLRLDGLSEGIYNFVVLPLPLVGADGSPCRAFIEVEHHP